MRLGITTGYSGAQLSLDMDLVLEAERSGFDSVWTSESYGSDAITPLAFIAARTTRIRLGSGIMQMPARTPAMTAMTAMTLDALSGGRFILGLGPSGPQVVEGWHGVPYGKPLGRTREYVAIVRQILARERPLEHQGEHYRIPYVGPGRLRARKALEEHLPRPPRSSHLHRLHRARRGRGERRDRRRPHPGLDGPRAFRPVFEPHLAKGFSQPAAARASPHSTSPPW